MEVFCYCYSLTNVTIPNSVTSIGQLAFTYCTSLSSVTIPNSVTSIESYAFYSCLNLTSVRFGNSITNIGSWAFNGSPNLEEVYFEGNAPVPDNDTSVFLGASKATAFYLPRTTGWGPLFDGLPTKLWLPRHECFGVQTNRFGFNINWACGKVVVVETCTDIVNPVWQPIATNTLTDGSCYFSDPHWTNYPNRFYRLRSP
jgi:hypothetical protein